MAVILIKPKDKAELKFISEMLQKMKISVEIIPGNDVPNALTAKTIENARKGKGIGPPIKNIEDFIGLSRWKSPQSKK